LIVFLGSIISPQVERVGISRETAFIWETKSAL
jgi:hypothetical protein